MHDTTESDEMNSGLGVAETDLLRRKLKELPDAPAPREVWQRIAAQAEAEGLFSKRGRQQPVRWLAAAGLAAAVTLIVLRLPTAPVAEGPFPTEPAYVEQASRGTLDALMVQSQLLENDLRSLPDKPRIMRAGTAATISDLEDQIAAIDQVLNDPAAGLSEAEIEEYWRQRVRLMDSLVQVRYVQARRNSL